MKKGVIVFALALVLASILESCKVVEPCPAYDSLGFEQSEVLE